MKIFIVGGAGKIARRLAKICADKGHQPLSLFRRAEQESELEKLGATPVSGDLTELTAEDLASLMAGCDALVFSAGAGGAGQEITNAIDGDGFRKSLQAAQMAGVKRFLQVSAFPESGRGGEPKEGFENYMRVKKQTDCELVASDRDWVILRPGTLTNDSGDGRINADLAVPYGNVSRDNVALTLATLIETPALHHCIIELTDGDHPVTDALQALADRS
ncbi:SDR family oxidoreductase [Altericroceibacterium spongiae]|nr:SDR family oxidoreductase [Altericroceibacterium spongiae]